MLNDHHKHLLDAGAWLFAIVAGISLAKLAFLATILAGFASFILALIRVHDRVRYGPSK